MFIWRQKVTPIGALKEEIFKPRPRLVSAPCAFKVCRSGVSVSLVVDCRRRRRRRSGFPPSSTYHKTNLKVLLCGGGGLHDGRGRGDGELFS